MPPPRALALLEPVLSALAAAHRAGLIHRDVKPENVLIADDGRVKVADFGLAKAVSADTQHTATGGVLIGTVSYLAPELVVDGRADARADVYAAGVLLFELLTGTKPHEGETPIQVAYKHVHEDVPAAVARRCPASRRTSTRWSPAPPPATATSAPPTPGCCCTSCTGSAQALADGVRDDPELTADLLPRVLLHPATPTTPPSRRRRRPRCDQSTRAPGLVDDGSRARRALGGTPSAAPPSRRPAGDPATTGARAAPTGRHHPPGRADQRAAAPGVPRPGSHRSSRPRDAGPAGRCSSCCCCWSVASRPARGGSAGPATPPPPACSGLDEAAATPKIEAAGLDAEARRDGVLRDRPGRLGHRHRPRRGRAGPRRRHGRRVVSRSARSGTTCPTSPGMTEDQAQDALAGDPPGLRHDATAAGARPCPRAR